MSKAHPPRSVIIVDDSRTIQAILDNAFSERDDFRVVGFASNADAAVELIRRLRPDIVTIDLCMPYIDGAALLAMLTDLPRVCKIMVSDRATENAPMTKKLVQLGAAACLGKSELGVKSETFFAKINAACDLVQKNNAARRSPFPNPQASPAWETSAEPDRAFAPASYPIPLEEARRLAAIRSKKLNNAVRERQFDLITKHVAETTAFPICLLTFVDEHTQWIKSAYGFDTGSTLRSDAFCNYTISQGGWFTVSNALKDERFAGNPFVAGEPHIRTYAGHPIVTSDGVRIGALCLIDLRPRTISPSVLTHLRTTSDILAEMINARPSLAA